MKATGVVRRIDDLGRYRYTKRNKKNTSHKRAEIRLYPHWNFYIILI